MRRSIASVLAVLLAAGTAHAGKHTDPKTVATQLNSEGHSLYNGKDYANALDRFQRAYQVYPSVGLLLNIATTLQQLGRLEEAANTYQRYLDDPGAQEPYATQTRTSLSVLDSMLGRLTIVVDGDPDGTAEVQIGDGMWTPAAQAKLLRVPAGTYVVRARRGSSDGDVTGRVGVGEQRAIEITLTTPASETATKPKPTPPPPPPAPKPTVAAVVPPSDDDVAVDVDKPRAPRDHQRWIAGGVAGAGVAALIAGGALALHAESLYGQSEKLCNGDPVCPGPDHDRAVALSASGGRDRWLAIGVGVVGAAAVATGAVLWIRAPHHPRGEPAALTFVATPDQVELALGGRF